jgi:hypothetical protein
MHRRSFLLAGAATSALAAHADARTLNDFAPRARQSSPPPIGGFSVGQVVTTGFYAGYTLSWGDDFLTAPDLVGPTNPKGAYFPARTFAGADGGATLPQRGGIAGVAPLTDPNWTGYLDANRGVAVGYNNIRTANSILTLQARNATAAESSFLAAPATNLNVQAELDTLGTIVHYPASRNATIVDVYCQTSTAFTSWLSGTEMGPWALSSAPAASLGSADEVDIFEAHGPTSSADLFSKITWAAGAALANASNSLPTGAGSAVDGSFHLVTCIFGATNVLVYVDETLASTIALSANTKSLPIRTLLEMFTGGAGFVQSDWTASGVGALSGMAFNVDYVRVWRTTGTNHYRPQATIADLNVAYGASGNMTLPAAATLWGGSPTNEVVETQAFEPNCPGLAPLGTTALATFAGLPTSNGINVTYNSGTRNLGVVHTNGNAGRLHGVVTAWDSTGSTCQPARFTINVGPNLTTPSLVFSSGVPCQYDAYYDADCGIITPKTFSISSAPAWLSITPDGIISGTAPSNGFYRFILTVTNSAGQSVSRPISLKAVSRAINFLGSAVVTDIANSSHTFSSCGIGPAYSTRYVIVGLTSRAGAATFTCTIGGVSATLMASILPGSTLTQVEFFAANVPTGATADIVISETGAGGVSRCCVAWWSTPNLSSFTPSAMAGTQTISGSGLSVSLDMPAGGVGIAMASFNRAGLGATWSGVDPNVARFKNQSNYALNSADYGSTVSFGSANFASANPSLIVSGKYIAGVTGSPTSGVLVAVALA